MLISKAVNSEDTGENSLEEPSKKGFWSLRENKSPLVVSGVVAKKPRKAIDEWIHMTRQHDILKRQFPEYDYHEKRNRTCVNYGTICLMRKKHHISRSIEKSMRIIKC